MRMSKNQRGPRAGFTLLEIILAMSLSFFLLAALYQAIVMQAQYSEYAAAEMRESQIARTLLHRIAAEIRAVEPPPAPRRWQSLPDEQKPETEQSTPEELEKETVPDQPDDTNAVESPTEAAPVSNPFSRAEQAHALLAFGESESASEGFAATLPSTTETEEATLASAPERFSLLGTSNRLLIRCHYDENADSVVEQFHADPMATPQAGLGGDSKQSAAGNVRQIFYFMRPNPALEEESLSADFSEDEEVISTYQGLVRQEIKRPWSIEAATVASLQMEPYFEMESEERIPSQESVTVPKEPRTSTDEIPPEEYVQTKIVAEPITAIKFRYHDGSSWLDAWDREDLLPAAVEISLSFEPIAEEEEELVDPVLMEEEEEPRFPYRLVVCLPQSGQVIRPTLEETETETDGEPGREEPQP